MYQLSSSEFQRLDSALRELYVHSNSETFAAHLLNSIRGLVASDITCYTEVQPEAQRVLNVADPTSDALDALLPVFAELQHQHPRVVDFAESGDTAARTISDYLTPTVWHKRDLFQHFYGALGLEDQLSIMMPARRDLMIGLVLNRSNRSFGDTDRRLLDLLRPHMTIAWHNAQAVSALDGTGLRPGAPGEATVIRLRGDGTVWYSTAAARDLLKRYFPARQQRDVLPDRLRFWIRRHLGQAGTSSVAPDRYTLAVRSARGILQIRLIGEAGVEGWLMLMGERRRGGVDGSAPLPPRLQRVLRRLLLGESEKEAAEALSLSPHTVHEYVKQLYKRLGVSSRSELLARWISGCEPGPGPGDDARP